MFNYNINYAEKEQLLKYTTSVAIQKIDQKMELPVIRIWQSISINELLIKLPLFL